MKNMKYEKMVKNILSYSNSYIKDKDGKILARGVALDKNIVVFVDENNKLINLYHKTDIVATIEKNNKSFKALRNLVDFLEECSDDIPSFCD